MAALLSAGAASAQPNLPPAAPPAAGAQADREAARAAFEQGTRLFEADDYAAALEAFNRAQRLRPHDKTRIPIATCLERLARFREAIAVWQQVRDSQQVGETDRAAATEAITRLRPRLATLVVTGRPAGAEVLVDEQARCRLPCRVAVDPREHLVVVRHGGHQQRQRMVFKRGQGRQLEVALTSPPPARGGAPDTARSAAHPLDTATDDSGTVGPGVLTWVGAAVAVVGAAGLVGFGLRANALHDEYLAAPSDELRDQGLLTRGLANASIAVGAAGLLAVAVDLVLLAPRERSVGRLGPNGLRLDF